MYKTSVWEGRFRPTDVGGYGTFSIFSLNIDRFSQFFHQ